MVTGFRYGDWRQLPGYFLSIVVLPELYVVRHMRDDQPRWVAYLAVLTFFASYVYAAILIRIFKRPNQDRSHKGQEL
jgi:hypothetical protein